MNGAHPSLHATPIRLAKAVVLLLLVSALVFGPWLGRLDLLEHDHGHEGRHVHTLPAGVAHGDAGQAPDWHADHHDVPRDAPANDRQGVPAPLDGEVSTSGTAWLVDARTGVLASPFVDLSAEQPATGPAWHVADGIDRPPSAAPCPARTRIERLLLSSHALLI